MSHEEIKTFFLKGNKLNESENSDKYLLFVIIYRPTKSPAFCGNLTNFDFKMCLPLV